MPSASPQVLLINASSWRVASVMPFSLVMSPSKRSFRTPNAVATVITHDERHQPRRGRRDCQLK